MTSIKGKDPAKSARKQPAMLTKIVAAILHSELKDSAKKNKAMAIVPSISNSIEAKYARKPAKHILRAAINRGTQDEILSRSTASRTGLNGSIKIHPKFSKFLLDRETGADNPKEIASAIRAFNKKPKRSAESDQEPVKPKKKATAVTNKPKTDFPVAKKKRDGSVADVGKGQKRPTKSQSQDEPKTKKAKK